MTEVNVYHSFNTNEAEKYGIEGAIILNNLRYWQSKNEANGKHFHQGKYWCYNSLSAWKELFPYMSEYAIRKALKKLEDEGAISVGNFNKSTYNRTNWYTVEINNSICRKRQMELLKTTNGIVENDKTITVIKHNNKHNINNTYSEDFENWFGAYHSDGKTMSGKHSAWGYWKDLTESEKRKCAQVVRDYVNSTPDMQFRKRAYNYLREKAFEDEIERRDRDENGNRISNGIDYGI